MSRSGPYSGHSYTAPAVAVAAGQSSFQLSAADLQLAGWAGAGLPREADRQSEAGVLRASERGVGADTADITISLLVMGSE